MTMTYYFDVDGVLANYHETANGDWRKGLSYDFIANLPVFAENIETLRNLIASGNTCYILSKVANENTKKARLEWLARYIPEMIAENIILIVGSGSKVNYIREDGILVDDDIKNIRPWVKAGHKAIHIEIKGSKIF